MQQPSGDSASLERLKNGNDSGVTDFPNSLASILSLEHKMCSRGEVKDLCQVWLPDIYAV